jgi:hypothetical protein
LERGLKYQAHNLECSGNAAPAVAYLSEWSLRQLAHLRISRFLNF